MKKISIIGSGGFAKEVYCLLADLGREADVIGFLEEDVFWDSSKFEQGIFGKPVLPLSTFDPAISTAVIGIGSSAIREKIAQKMPEETEFATLIHPSAVVSKWVEIGPGSIICAGCIITCDIKIGKHAQLNLQTTIGHDCVIGDYFTTAPGVKVSGNCTIGNHVYLGTSAATKQGITIGEKVVLGMGAMAVKDLLTPGTYIGVPAQLLVK